MLAFRHGSRYCWYGFIGRLSWAEGTTLRIVQVGGVRYNDHTGGMLAIPDYLLDAAAACPAVTD